MRSKAAESTALRLLLPLLAGCPTALAQATRTAELFSPTSAPLFARAGCPDFTFHCPASLGAAFADVCCETGQTCAFDENNQPACCPSGIVCTGNAPTSQPTGKPKPSASYVSNPYFSFPYIATDFDSRGDCTSAVSACSANYDACVTRLAGASDDDESGGTGNFGVTIVVPGSGGTTINGAAGAGAAAASLGASSASSICESLSREACSQVKETQCSEFQAGDDDSAAAGRERTGWAAGVAGVMMFAALVAEIV